MTVFVRNIGTKQLEGLDFAIFSCWEVQRNHAEGSRKRKEKNIMNSLVTPSHVLALNTRPFDLPHPPDTTRKKEFLKGDLRTPRELSREFSKYRRRCGYCTYFLREKKSFFAYTLWAKRLSNTYKTESPLSS